jgi:hypothetical protein
LKVTLEEPKDTMSDRYDMPGICEKTITVINEAGVESLSILSNGTLTVLSSGLYTAYFSLESYPQTQSIPFNFFVPV